MDVWYDGSHAISFYRFGTSDDPVGSLIGHTWLNWGLVPTSKPVVAPPSQKTSTIEIQGADGVIDISESITKWPLFNNRTGSWSFYVTDYKADDSAVLDNNDEEVLDNVDDPIIATVLESWASAYSKLLNAIHGKTMVIVLDDDPEYFYKGRFKISQWTSPNDGSLTGLTIDYDLFPYKMKKEFEEIDLIQNPQISISSGRQTIIPEIKTTVSGQGDATAHTLTLSFSNPEMGIAINSYSHSPGTTNYRPMENMANGKSFTLTNISGINVCTLNAQVGSSFTEAKIRYRIGEL